jgi:hypothetical protein
MSVLCVLLLLDSWESPTLKSVILPACLTLVGYATPSRIVSSAVTRVRMIVQLVEVMFGGQTGATSGVCVAPS